MAHVFFQTNEQAMIGRVRARAIFLYRTAISYTAELIPATGKSRRRQLISTRIRLCCLPAPLPLYWQLLLNGTDLYAWLAATNR
jgi:hypothetical protein